jgi:hypothetical protein
VLWTDLIELKTALEIDPDDQSEDARLNLWLKAACEVLESYLGYPIFRMTRTEFYGGTGTQKLTLRCHPVYADANLQVLVDRSGNFGVSSGSFDPGVSTLVYGTDFGLWLDHPTDPIRSDRGILLRYNSFWERPAYRTAGLLSPYVEKDFGTIKVTYTGGRFAEDLPYDMVLAAITATARIRFMMPLGLNVSGDSYEGRSISIQGTESNWIIGQVKHLLFKFRNRRF